jgi:hypothetical protein
MAGGRDAARELVRGSTWKPTPLLVPKREGKPLSPETATVTRDGE